VWADIFDVDQSTISRYITFLTPLVEDATEEDPRLVPKWVVGGVDLGGLARAGL